MRYLENLEALARARDLWFPLHEDDLAIEALTFCDDAVERLEEGTDSNQSLRLFLQVMSEDVGLTDPFPSTLPIDDSLKLKMHRFFAEEMARMLLLMGAASEVRLHWK